jgi:hypothetical protein
MSEEKIVRTLEDAKPLTAANGAVSPRGALSFQAGCIHPSSRWVHGPVLDYRVCQRCRAVLEEGWPDHHPEISRWLNEGGAA